MLGGDTNDYDIDGRNCNGDMLIPESNTDSWFYDDSPKTIKYQFSSLEELLQCVEVRTLIQKTIACKDEQIRELQNELLRLSDQ